MPNLETYSLQKICELFDEAVRAIPGYESYDPTYEPKALIDYSKTKDNYALKINDCMLHKKGERNKSKKIESLIQDKTGKTPRKDSVACSIIVTLPRDYEGDERVFFHAAYKALIITCGIKEDDVLYAVVHKDETQPHLHFAFIPTSYCTDYDAKKEQWEAAKAEAEANGTKVPARPTVLKGECNRKVAEDEKAIGCNCGRFGKGFLHTLNRTLEERMAEQGVECRIGNGAGSKFNPQQMMHKQREESVRLFKEAEKYRKEAISAKEELEQMQEKLEEKEIELEEKETQIHSMKALIKELQEELASLVKEVALFVPNIIKAFIEGWKEAKSITQRRKIDANAQEEALSGAEEMAEHLRELGSKAEALLEEEMVSGIKMATFEPSPQKIGFAKKQIEKMAIRKGEAEVFADSRVIDFALQDWFDKKKYKKKLIAMSELDASLYIENSTRAARAIEYAFEKMKEEEMEMALDERWLN